VNYEIRYLTRYRYSAGVMDNLNALRVRPATTSLQRCDEFHVRLEPEARIVRHADYFGTEVLEFGVARPHDHLTIDVRARVVTSEPAEPPEAPWEALSDPRYEEAGGEFLLGGWEPVAEAHETQLADLVAAAEGPTPLATLRRVCDLIPDRFAYRPGVTYVDSAVGHLLSAGAGVCQDFVHLALVLLRRRGIAARYVSGYLFSASQDGGTDSVEGQTHAWVEALLPGTEGRGEPVWVAADPTNRRLAGETHVKIGHGRRYSDVPPIKGVFRGIAGAELEASVRMTRLDPATSARA